MINVLLSTYNFNSEDCFPLLKYILEPGMQVCILPYSHDEVLYSDYDKFDWVYDYDDPSSDYNAIARAYKDYGIEKIRIVHPKDNLSMIEDKIRKSDILFFTGGNPVQAMERMEPIIPLLKDYDGIVMGASAGAMVQVREFVIDGEGYDYSYYKGLGFVKYDMDVIVHYNADPHLKAIIIRSLNERPLTKIYAIKDGECLIIY